MRVSLLTSLVLVACSESAQTATPVDDIGLRIDAPSITRNPFDAGMYEPVSLDLGTGLERFESVAPFGDRVELIHGPQGGYHILGRYRFATFQPDVFVYFRVTPVDGGAPVNDVARRLRRIERMGLTRTATGFESAYAELVIFTEISFPTEVVGRRFVWEIVVEEVSTGRLATTRREITVVDDLP